MEILTQQEQPSRFLFPRSEQIRWLAIIQITRCRASTNRGKNCRHLRRYSCRVPCKCVARRERPPPARHHTRPESSAPGTSSAKYSIILAALSGLYFFQGAPDLLLSHIGIDMPHYERHEVTQAATVFGTRRNSAPQIVTPELRKQEDKVV